MAKRTNSGRFVWLDLMTSEPEQAIAFYTGLLGWTTEIWENEEGPYTMWVNREKPLGGVMDIPAEAAAAGAPPNWMAYVAVDDTDDAATKVCDLGGAVLHPPTDIPGVGRFSVVSDPQGACIAVFTPTADSGEAPVPPQIGEFSWHELATSNNDSAFAFYNELFGWQKLEAMDMGAAGVYQIYGLDGTPFGGMFRKPAEMPTPMWLYYVRVADMDEAVARVAELGGEVINGPMEVPGGDKIAQCTDPQGALFALHSSAG